MDKTPVPVEHHTAHWGYTGETGPEQWGTMSEKYKLCGTGENQAPIDVHGDYDVALPPIQFNYGGKAEKVTNNGHTVQVDISEGSSIAIEGKTFALKQFHFHTPSENTVNGEHFPLEAHFVHQIPGEPTYAVVAVMFEEGAANPVLEKVWSDMPEKAEEHAELDGTLDYSSLLPKDQDYYRFNGSFTTPPCTEGVRWFVMKKPLSASKEQIEKFLHVMHHPNNRPVQDLGARLILQ